MFFEKWLLIRLRMFLNKWIVVYDALWLWHIDVLTGYELLSATLEMQIKKTRQCPFMELTCAGATGRQGLLVWYKMVSSRSFWRPWSNPMSFLGEQSLPYITQNNWHQADGVSKSEQYFVMLEYMTHFLEFDLLWWMLEGDGYQNSQTHAPIHNAVQNLIWSFNGWGRGLWEKRNMVKGDQARTGIEMFS